MRVTVDITDEQLQQLAALTGEAKKGPAILRAVEEFIQSRKLREFADMIREGKIRYDVTNEEIEAGDAARDESLYGKER